MTRMTGRNMALFALMLAGLFILAACAEAAQPTATTVPVDPTPAAEATPTVGTGSPQPTATTRPPDPAAGEALFNSNGCSGCHSTGSNTIVGPGLAGIGERAGTRIPGMSADEYLHESIVDSQAFIVPDFPPSMPPSFPNLSETDVNDLVAYLKTLQ